MQDLNHFPATAAVHLKPMRFEMVCLMDQVAKERLSNSTFLNEDM